MDPRSRVLFWLMTGMLHAISLLPDFLLYPIGVAAGWIGYQLDRRHVRIGMKNLAIAFPEKSAAERAGASSAPPTSISAAAAPSTSASEGFSTAA